MDRAAWGMSHMTVDMGRGDFSNVRFVWGLYLICECQLLYEPKAPPLPPPQHCVLYVIVIVEREGKRERGVDSFFMLCCHGSRAEGFTVQLVFISLWYFWIVSQRDSSRPFPLMANLASNDVMRRHNDALHRPAFGCPWFSLLFRRMSEICSLKESVEITSPSMRTRCTTVSPR